MSILFLDQMKRLINRSVNDMHIPQVETGIIVIKDNLKQIQLEESKATIPFSMCEFNQNLQNYTIRFQIGEGEVQEMKIFNALQVQERVAVTVTQGGRHCIVHHKVVQDLYDGL